MENDKKVIIIGAGIGGLALAALLGKKGYKVTVLEKNSTIGGRAMHFKSKGFTFDMGPSWYLMPDVFEKYYKIFNKRPSDFFKLIHLDPHYRIFFSDDEIVDIVKDLKKNLEIFEKIEKGSAKKIKEYLKKSEYQYKVAMNEFVYKNYNSIFDFFNKRIMKEGPKLNIFESFDKYVSRFVESDKIKKILQYSVVFLGGSPKNTPAMYSLMSHIDFNMGVFYPIGGINKIIDSLETLGKENKVNIIKNSEVKKIITKNSIAVGVKTKNKTYEADLIISNADYPFTELKLLDENDRSYDEKYWNKKTLAPSAFIIYLGVKGKVKKLKHHNLFFANDWEEHFQEIFKNPALPNKPSYYICSPSKSDNSVAPKNHENIFILVPVAANLKLNEKLKEKYSKSIITHFENIINEKISDRIVFKKIFTQDDYESLYNSFRGTALGLSHTFFQTAIFRPSNKSKKLKNLYYVGQYTNPGIGMPMAIISAQLTAERILNDEAKKKFK